MKVEYIVTCKSMFANGQLTKQGETFIMDEETAKNYQGAHPHLTFEKLEDYVNKDRGKSQPRGRKPGRKANPRLQPDSKKGGAVKASRQH